MSFSFGRHSKMRLLTCHELHRELWGRVIKYVDVSILCGHRDRVSQNEAFAGGNSLAKWPESKHNTFPSEAVDAAPWPTLYDDIPKIMAMREIVLREWSQMNTGNYILVWGGDWDGDGDYTDQKLFDPVHWEIRKK